MNIKRQYPAAWQAVETALSDTQLHEISLVFQHPVLRDAVYNVTLGELPPQQLPDGLTRLIYAASQLFHQLLSNTFMTEVQTAKYVNRSVKTLQNHRALNIGVPFCKPFETDSRAVRYNRLKVDLWLHNNSKRHQADSNAHTGEGESDA